MIPMKDKGKGEYGMDELYREDEPAFLVNVAGDMEGNIIQSLMASFGIPVMKKYKGTGDSMKVYMGSSNLGIDIYVPGRLLDKARELLASQNGWSEGEEAELEEENLKDIEGKYKKSRVGKARILLAVLVVPFSLAIIYGAASFIRLLMSL